jgi:hypothetical protein
VYIFGLLVLTISFLFAEIEVQNIKAKKLDEPSGLLVSKKYPNILWSHNDSGDKARLYALDSKTLKLVKKIKIKKADNIDWEDITYHKGNIVIGDFGNNKNKRKDLTLYTIKEPNPYTDKKAKVIKTQTFIFSDQKTSRLKRKNFDCEAMFSFNDELYLLTKHRADNNTTLYHLKGSCAEKIVSFPLDRRVTGADSDGKQIVILTYGSLYLFEPKKIDSNFFKDGFRSKELEHVGQVEGVALDGKALHVISEEGKLYSLHVRDLK